MSNEVEEARAVLRWAAGRSSIRAIADDVGVEQSVLNRFIAGKAKKPRPDVLAKLLPYVARRRQEYARATEETATVANTSATPPTGAPTVAIPLRQIDYWRGVLETEHRHLHGITRSLESLLAMLNDSTAGIGGFVASGVLGPSTLTQDDVLALVERQRQEKQQATQQPQGQPRAG